MHLYVARHGETLWNAENKICGRTDLPLTEEGLRQAQLLADRVEKLSIDMILSSPMLRAMQTAEPAAKRKNLPILTDERLIEQNYGVYEGLDRQHPGFLANKRQFAYRYPGGESMMDVAYRVYSLIKELKERYPDQNVLLVCHGDVCRLIRTYFEDMTNEEFFHYSEENAGV